MKQIYEDSIAKARSYYEGFDDALHDWAHSERVATNARLMADNIGYKDKDFLTLCALWHDTARASGSKQHEEDSALLARKDLLERGANADLAERACEAIRFHKSTASPTTIEGKIIRDADKLDIFCIDRYKRCMAAGWTEEYSRDLKKTIDNINIAKYPDAFTYDFTKEKFKEQLPGFLRYYESIKPRLYVA